MPRRRSDFLLLGYALGAAFGRINPKGQARTKGIAQNNLVAYRRGVAIAAHPAAKPKLTLSMTFGQRLLQRTLNRFGCQDALFAIKPGTQSD